MAKIASPSHPAPNVNSMMPRAPTRVVVTVLANPGMQSQPTNLPLANRGWPQVVHFFRVWLSPILTLNNGLDGFLVAKPLPVSAGVCASGSLGAWGAAAAPF